MNYTNKVVVITGATSGIGEACAAVFGAAGAKLVITGRNAQKLEATAAKLQAMNLTVLPILADAGSEADNKRMAEEALARFGRIDILINNAGISMRALLKDATTEVIKKVMDINLMGVVFCTRYALASLIKSKGTIVGVSSIAGYRGLPGRSGYSASKFALQGFLESIRTELIDDGVHVMWVCPGFTTSNIRHAALDKNAEAHGETSMDEDKMMSADECAKHILNAIAKKKRTLVLTFTGKRTVFMNRFFPAWADKLVYRFFFKGGKLIK